MSKSAMSVRLDMSWIRSPKVNVCLFRTTFFHAHRKHVPAQFTKFTKTDTANLAKWRTVYFVLSTIRLNAMFVRKAMCWINSLRHNAYQRRMHHYYVLSLLLPVHVRHIRSMWMVSVRIVLFRTVFCVPLRLRTNATSAKVVTFWTVWPNPSAYRVQTPRFLVPPLLIVVVPLYIKLT